MISGANQRGAVYPRPVEYWSRLTQRLRLCGPLAADPTARMLNTMLWVLTLWFGIWGIILLPFHFKDWFWSLQNQIATDAALVAALLLLRRGRFRAATFTYLGAIWVFATLVMVLNGGIRSSVQVLYVTLPISAAWLLGYGAAVWISAGCFACTLAITLLQVSGVNLPSKIPGTPFGAWVVFVMGCAIGAVPVAQILRDLRSALERSRRAEEKAHGTAKRLHAEIEECIRTEQALRESEERFRITADTAPVMILLHDAGQHATFFNKGWLDFTGHGLAQELGSGWTGSLHPNDSAQYLADLAAAYARREQYQTEFRLRRADGEYRLILCHGVPRFEADRTFRGYIASCVDITDFKRREEDALARQKWESLGVLAAGIAHDFNNLLGGIRAQSELLMDDVQDPASRTCVAKIQAVTVRASEVVRQLMLYAGQETGALELVDFAGLVRDMLPLMNVSAGKNASFELYLPEGLPPIRGNPTQLRQMLLNLITNASEALGGKSGVISLSVTKLGPEGPASPSHSLRDDSLLLQICDTGCGMTDDIRAAIFDPFFTTKGAGRGLGLAAVQGIVRSHGGHIVVVSSPAGGSRFEILFPIASGAEEIRSEAGRPQTPPSFAATALIIEDEESLRRGVAKLLRARGLRVLEAGDGHSALELCRHYSSEIDVVILDVTLPGLSGGDVLQKLREIDPSLKVIITSAYGRNRALEAVNGDLAQPYIRKPYRIEELLELIQRVSDPAARKCKGQSGSGS